MAFFTRSLVLVLTFSFLAPSFAYAKSESLSTSGKKAKIVGKAAIYGFGGGLIVGVASQVFKRKTKNIFMFGSLGMYAGILLGIYVISTSSGPSPYEGPDTYEDYGDFSYRTFQGPNFHITSHSDRFKEEQRKSEISLQLLTFNF